MSGEFSVYQFFADGSYEETVDHVDAKTAVDEAWRLTRTLGGRLGPTVRIIITDRDDCTCFEWQFGKGVTFPPITPLEDPR